MTVSEWAHQLVPRWDRSLVTLGGIVAAACIGYTIANSSPLYFDVLELVVPLAVSIGLCVFVVQVRTGTYEVERPGRLVLYGWMGALAAVVVSGWCVAILLYYDAQISVLVDELLTVVGGCIVAGMVVARSAPLAKQTDSTARVDARSCPADSGRVLAETSWTTRPGPDPILVTIVELLADADDCDFSELDPVYDYLDPDILSKLRTNADAHWQLRFFVDEYEIRVSSQGTVTLYETAAPETPSFPLWFS